MILSRYDWNKIWKVFSFREHLGFSILTDGIPVFKSESKGDDLPSDRSLSSVSINEASIGDFTRTASM